MKSYQNFSEQVRRQLHARLPSLKAKLVNGLAQDIEYLSLGGVAPKYSAEASEVGIPIQPPAESTKFVLGQRSTSRLSYLLPKLSACVQAAIGYTSVDFTVLQTIRTREEQKAAVKAGNSRTMKSKHLKQPDGFAHAVDLGAWVNGKVSWEFELYADIALAMDLAATELGVADHVRWGCAWDRVLSDFGGSHKAYLDEAKAYSARHKGSDLLDGPHFEWVE